MPWMINLTNLSLARKLTASAILLIAGSLTILTLVVYLTIISFGETFLENELTE